MTIAMVGAGMAGLSAASATSPSTTAPPVRSPRRRQGPEAWVIHATETWSQQHLEDPPDHVAATLAAQLGPLPDILTATAHRWRYARARTPPIESAWLSGQALANRINRAAP